MTLLSRVAGAARRALEHRAALPVALSLSLIGTAPALWTPFAADDWVHKLLLRDDPGIAGFDRAPLDLFVFASGRVADNVATIDEGVFPWWTDPEARLAFFRPLTSLTHWLDESVAPNSPLFAHLHNLLWLTAALVAVSMLFRRMSRPAWAATLAAAMYALDDAHGPTYSWIAARNSLITLALGAAALTVHDRWRRDGWAPGRWAGPALFAAALLAGEAAIGAGAYFFAHALCMERTWRERVTAFAPYAAIGAIWHLAYSTMGYGAYASGVYVDPGRDPTGFLHSLFEYGPVLLSSQFAIPWSEFYLAPSAEWQELHRLIAWGVCGTLALAFAPMLRRDREARFWALGCLCATIPVTATIPADRLLMALGVGAMGLVARYFAVGVIPPETATASSVPETAGARALRNAGVGLRGLVAAALLLLHVVLGPLLHPIRATSTTTVANSLDQADRSIPRDESIRDRDLIALNPPFDPLLAYIPLMREARGVPRARHQRWLATGASALHVGRPDDRTLVVRPEAGWLAAMPERMLRRVDRPIPVGEPIRLSGLSITVTEVAPDGRPAEAEFRFDAPLEDPKWLWLEWGIEGYVAWTPPPIGSYVVIPMVDVLGALFSTPGTERASQSPDAD